MEKKNISLYLVLASILSLSACAQQSASNSRNSTPNTRRVTDRDGAITNNESVRYCETALTSSSSSKLSNFFSVIVSGLEGTPTICHEIDGFGSSGVDMHLMVEYEDNAGIRSVEFSPDNIISSKLVESGSNYSLEVIFKDDYGLVKVVGAGPQSTSIVTASIYYYNFPSYEDALNDAIEELREQCQNGTKTVYECLGYTYPTNWWNESTLTTSQKDMAKAIMNDSTKRKLLGKAQIDLGANDYPH